MSLIEAITNVAVGFLVALLTQIIVFPLFGLQASFADNLALGSIFTGLCRARHNPVYAEHIVMRSLRRLGLTPQGSGAEVTPHNSGGWWLRRASPSACPAR
jgi:hypothetical protein